MASNHEHRPLRLGVRARVGEVCHSFGMTRCVQRTRAVFRHDLRILAYHRVLTVEAPDAFDFDLDLVSTSVDAFREQMQFIKRHCRPIRLGQVADALDAGTPLPHDAVVVTFDDGYDDNCRNTYPILKELGIPATFFVCTGHIGSSTSYAYDWLAHMVLCTGEPRLDMPELNLHLPIPHDRSARRELVRTVLAQLKALAAEAQTAAIDRLSHQWGMPASAGHDDCRAMSWAQLQEMVADGYEVGSHGVHHRMLAKLKLVDCEQELRQSMTSIQQELSSPATTVAYPVGGAAAFNEQVMSAAGRAGYRLGCSYIRGTNPGGRMKRFALRRLPVEREMGIGWFAAMLASPELMSDPDHDAVA